MNLASTTALSLREKEVLEGISLGLTVNEIAQNLFLSKHTVIHYRRNLLKKLKAKNGACMVRRAYECGLLNFKHLEAC